MEFIKNLALNVSYAAGLQRLLARSPDTSLTTILFHRFFFDGESRNAGRERLRRQCEWMAGNYSPLTLAGVAAALERGETANRPLLITIDDARTDILEALEIFGEFKLPATVFACVGWCANASEAEDETLLARAVTLLEWYAGPDRILNANGGRLRLGLNSTQRRASIDDLLANRHTWRPHLEELMAQLDDGASAERKRTCCTWSELADLHNSGTSIGCHSVSHIKLAETSPARLEFEITEAQRILTAKFGECRSFAYPYGTPGTFNQATDAELKRAGIQLGFLTHAGFADASTELHQLPRIALPDRAMSFREFRARVAGGGVIVAKAKDVLRRAQASH